MLEILNLSRKKIEKKIFFDIYHKIFKKDFELSLVLATPLLLRKLNKKYRGKDKAANVLSFSFGKSSGEIFINISEKDLKYLFIHGSLHLLHYDHIKDKDAKRMDKMEKKILEQIN